MRTPAFGVVWFFGGRFGAVEGGFAYYVYFYTCMHMPIYLFIYACTNRFSDKPISRCLHILAILYTDGDYDYGGGRMYEYVWGRRTDVWGRRTDVIKRWGRRTDVLITTAMTMMMTVMMAHDGDDDFDVDDDNP